MTTVSQGLKYHLQNAGILDWFRYKLNDPKYCSVIFALAITYGGTAIAVYYCSHYLTQHSENFLISFAASWLQDLTLFIVIGVALYRYSVPFRPDKARFDERILAFYGPKAPKPLLDYAKNQLRRYSGYAPWAKREIIVTDYNQELNAYRVEIENIYQIKNLFKDVLYEDTPFVRVCPDNFDCQDETILGEMEWIKIGDQDILDGSPLIIKGEDYKKAIRLEIPKGGEIQFGYKYWIWIKIGEISNMRPQRVVEKFEALVRNRMRNMSIIMQIEDSENLEVIEPGQHRNFRHAADVTPEDDIFNFRFIDEKEH